VKAALSHGRSDFTLLNKWLAHVKDVYRLHRDELDAINCVDAKANRLVELNVIEQVNNLAFSSLVQDAWRSEQRPMIHGWVYALDDGLLQQQITLGPESEIDPIYRWDDEPAQPAH
jgi:carbonic anhydrase